MVYCSMQIVLMAATELREIEKKYFCNIQAIVIIHKNCDSLSCSQVTKFL